MIWGMIPMICKGTADLAPNPEVSDTRTDAMDPAAGKKRHPPLWIVKTGRNTVKSCPSYPKS